MLTIRVNSVNYTFKNPLFGYKTIIDLSIKWKQQDGNKFIPWDNGIAYTTRKCQCTFALDKVSFASLMGIFIDQSKGRNLNLELTPSPGFHLFGADRGDTPTFKCRLLSVKQRASIGHPQDVLLADCEFLFNDPSGFPAYTPPVAGIGGQKAQGVLSIGTITNLRYPDDLSTPDLQYAVNTILTGDGTPYGNDQNYNVSIATLNLTQNESKTAELIAYLVNTIRATTVRVVPPANSYLFGIENGDTGLYDCRMLNERIEITNTRYNEFTFPLTFWLEAIGE